ncbi:aminodeoxychorismate synthase component I [Lacinutrix iliipiscaria]|uniref:Aminodeoxychorismate synthase component I n=1 Tax=Lacinutrix iliipiscaria TaxID=1230532 RepID=A0ABW5WQR5_9FLAO
MRQTRKHLIDNIEIFKTQLLAWSQQFDDVVWLDSNHCKQKYSKYDAVLAVDAFTSIQTDYSNGFNKLKDYQNTTGDWIFGYLTYDLKNDVEQLGSNNFDGLEFPDLYFFQPKKLFLIKGKKLVIKYLNSVINEWQDDIKCIETYSFDGLQKVSDHPIKIKLRTSKDEYFNKLDKMLYHIHRGDIYEANFCQEFYTENTQIHPLETYLKLNAISKTPFAAFLKVSDKYVLSASPERYIKKKGRKIVSQPIKGTAKRSDNYVEDQALIQQLKTDEKERSENIMIVDLVRNDLSKTAKKGSVKVKELCQVYTFKQVHQMISTIISKVKKEVHPVDVLQTTFPMGSMTGAPKISAMEIIETLEDAKRGLYSGAVGYFSPKGNFDFNVVIRSILYNETNKYVSYSVGGAITAKSQPLKEYEECLVKAKAMREVLES